MTPPLRRKRCMLLAIAVAAAPALTRADETWNNAVTDGNWTLPANWIPAALPASTDNVFITASDAADRTVTLDTTSTVQNLTMGNGGAGTHTLVQTGPFDLTTATESLGATTAGIGIHLQSAGHNNTQQLDLGDDSGGIGFYTLSGTSTLTVAHEEYLYNGTFAQTAGTHTIDNLYVGAGASPAGYLLQSGTLTVNTDENISDTGAFQQTGGTHSIGQSLIAADYTLSGPGVLSVTGDSGVFNFTQTAGTHTVGGTLSIVTSYALGGPSTLHATADENLGILNGNPATFTQTGGTHQIDGTLSIATQSADAATYSLSSGTLTANAIHIAGPGVLTQSGGILNISALQLTTGGKMTTATGADPTLQLDSLAIDSSSTLDLNDNDLVVNNGVFSDIHNLVLTGYRDHADPAATGIISTTSQSNGGNTILILFNNALAGATEWPAGSGVSVDPNAIIGKYTYFGDTNLDGQVTAADYNAVDASLGTTGIDPGLAAFAGDTNFDNNITAADYNSIDSNIGLGVGNPLAAASTSSVPEPASLTLLALGTAAMFARRRRHNPISPSPSERPTSDE